MISTLSIICLGVSAGISVCLPVALFLFFRKRYGLKVVPLLVGGTSFFLAVMILEPILHAVVLRPAADGTVDLMVRYPFLYMLYGSFAAGVFEESARFLCFQLMKRKYHNSGTAISYGIGHGGLEAILLVGLGMIANIVFSLLSNSGTAETMKVIPEIDDAIHSLRDTPSYMFLLGGIERIFAICLQISFSILVWYAVNQSGKKRWFLVAIILHAVVDMPALLLRTGTIESVWVVEILLFASTLALVFLAARMVRRTEQAVLDS